MAETFFYSSILWFLFCSNIRFERARIKFTFSIEKNNKITENLSDRLKRKHFYVATVPFHTHILFSPKKKRKWRENTWVYHFLKFLHIERRTKWRWKFFLCDLSLFYCIQLQVIAQIIGLLVIKFQWSTFVSHLRRCFLFIKIVQHKNKKQ